MITFSLSLLRYKFVYLVSKFLPSGLYRLDLPRDGNGERERRPSTDPPEKVNGGDMILRYRSRV